VIFEKFIKRITRFLILFPFSDLHRRRIVIYAFQSLFSKDGKHGTPDTCGKIISPASAFSFYLKKKLNKYKKIPFLTIINISHTSANNLSENKEIHAFCPIFLM
jgi:hypothetical protein